MRLKTNKISLLLPVLLLITANACETALPPHPAFHFTNKKGFIYENSFLDYQTNYKIGLEVKAEGKNNQITSIKIYKNDTAWADSSLLASSVQFKIFATKNKLYTEKWEFITTDSEGGRGRKIISVYLKTKNFKYRDTVFIGTQFQPAGSFYSLSRHELITEDAIPPSPGIVDMLVYYNPLEKSIILSSPRYITSNLWFPDADLQNWETKNRLAFKKLNIDTAFFNQAVNDSLLFYEFLKSDTLTAIKDPSVEDIYGFQKNNKDFGMFRIDSIDVSEAGGIHLDVKYIK